MQRWIGCCPVSRNARQWHSGCDSKASKGREHIRKIDNKDNNERNVIINKINISFPNDFNDFLMYQIITNGLTKHTISVCSPEYY